MNIQYSIASARLRTDSTLRTASLMICVLLTCLPVGAGTLINVDFNSSGGNTQWGTYASTGVLGGGTWNGITVTPIGQGGSSLPTTSLLDSAGTSSGASVAITPFWSSWNMTSSEASAIDSNWQPLMADFIYLQNTATSATITLSGLGASTSWGIVLYAAATDGSGSSFTIDGATRSTTDPGAIGSNLAENLQYVHFRDILADGSGNISIDWAKNGNTFGVLNGMQIIAVPEPSSLWMAVLLAVVGRRKARLRRSPSSSDT